MYTYICTFRHVYIYIYMYVYISIHICIYSYVYIYVNMLKGVRLLPMTEPWARHAPQTDSR